MSHYKNFTRHLLECQCVLSIYKNNTVPVYHKFPVFSNINDNNEIETKYVLCNNCDALHEVQDICKSEIKWGKDAFIALVNTKDDIKFNLSSQGKENIIEILEKNNCDISIWELVEYIIENNLEENVILEKKEIDNNIVYSCLYINQGSVKIKKEIVQRYF